MLAFPSPQAVRRAGFRVVAYDIENQMFVVKKGKKRLTMRSTHSVGTLLVEEKLHE